MHRADHQGEAQESALKIICKDFVVLDTETTGLNLDDEVIEISIINCTGDILLDTLIRPLKKIPSSATAIHGITNEDVRYAPNWRDVHNKYADLIKDKIVVIYNRNFDIRLIQQTCKKYELTAPTINARCAMLLYAKYYGQRNIRTDDYRWHKLTDAIAHFGLVSHSRHRALTDAQMTLYLIYFMAGVVKNVELHENGPCRIIRSDITGKQSPDCTSSPGLLPSLADNAYITLDNNRHAKRKITTTQKICLSVICFFFCCLVALIIKR